MTRATWVGKEQSTAHLEVVMIILTERAHPEERKQWSEPRERHSARNKIGLRAVSRQPSASG